MSFCFILVEKPVPEKKPRQKKQQNSSSNPSAELRLLPLINEMAPLLQNNIDLIDIESQNSQSSVKSISSVSSTQSLPKPDFVPKEGQFEIVLCIDNREFYGGGYVFLSPVTKVMKVRYSIFS